MHDGTTFEQFPAFDIPPSAPCADIDEVFRSDPDFTPLGAAERRRRAGEQIGRRPESASQSNRFEERPIELVLYVSSISPHSKTALRNIRRALSRFANVPFALTVHDLSKEPQRAAADHVHFTPTLVTGGKGPRTWILGHLENPQVLDAFLESAVEQVQRR